VVLWWALDRLGRNLRHLITLIDELQAKGIVFVSLREGIDATTPAGRLQLHILAALAGFERARIQERIRSGIARARRNGTRLCAQCDCATTAVAFSHHYADAPRRTQASVLRNQKRSAGPAGG
jgi:hypothetical protein